jgi:2-methylcitrate dehydratase PrpD
VLTEELLRAAVEATAPTAALRRAGLRKLFDFCACVIGGCAAAPSWPYEHAGVLAYCAHAQDQDDLNLDSLTHPGGIVWSAVVACALGYELMVRLGEAAGAEHRALWHVTATAGTVAAAGAAAKMLGAGEPGIDAAVAHAVSVAAGSAHAMAQRSGTRMLHRAHAASSGVACARAAGAGLSASLGVLESGRGAFAPSDPTGFAAALLAPRPLTGLQATGFRIHPATGFAHAAIDAALALGPIEAGELEQVMVTVSPAVALAVASNPNPSADEQAWWSIEHAVAVALLAADEHAATGALSTRADVLDLCRRVQLAGGGPGWGATVTVTLRDGDTRSGSVDGPLGHGSRPASDEDLCRKWRRLTDSDGSAFLSDLLAVEDELPLARALAGATGSFPSAGAPAR